MHRMFCCDVVFQDLSKCHMGLGILDLLQFLFTRFSSHGFSSHGSRHPRSPPISLHQVFIFLTSAFAMKNNSFHWSLASVDVEVRGSFMADFICRYFTFVQVMINIISQFSSDRKIYFTVFYWSSRLFGDCDMDTAVLHYWWWSWWVWFWQWKWWRCWLLIVFD